MRKKKWNEQLLINEIQRISQELKRKPFKRDCLHIYATTRNYFGTWNNAVEKAGFEIKKLQKPIIPKEFTPRLAYFLGLLITDGHLTNYKNTGNKVIIFTSYCEEKEIILNLIKEIFSYNASVRTKKYGFNQRPNYEIYISSNSLVNYFVEREIPSGAKSSSVRVPKFLFTMNMKIKASFIRGVIDGDGTISPKTKYARIASGSELFLIDLKSLLNSLGINSGKILKDKIANTWVLNIFGIENLRTLGSALYSDSNYCYPRKRDSWKGI